MKKAVLDIGSNSVKYILADVRPGNNLDILEEESRTTRLVVGVEKSGGLTGESIQKTLEISQKCIQRAQTAGAKRILAFATSAVRDAKNRTEFQSLFKRTTGIDLVTLTGKEEATLVFTGAVSDPDFPQHHVVVMDVGGGSAEWILGSHGKMTKHHCAPLGCVRMTERFLEGDPYTHGSFDQLMKHVKMELAKIKPVFNLEHRHLVATGGTACALAALDCAADRKLSEVHGRILKLERVQALLHQLCDSTQAQREKMPGIARSRADIVTAGAAVFAEAMDVLGSETMQVSVRGLRYGALYS